MRRPVNGPGCSTNTWTHGATVAARPKELDLQPGFGTLGLACRALQARPCVGEVSARSRPDYERAFHLVLSYKLNTGQELRMVPLNAISARGVDKLYLALQKSERVGRRLRQANVCMTRIARAWDAVHRLYPTSVPTENPFRGVELEQIENHTAGVSLDAYALHAALVAAGEPHLAAVPLICFEWHQRPENVLAGHLTWGDYRPPERPNAARIVHHKTGELVRYLSPTKPAPCSRADGVPG